MIKPLANFRLLTENKKSYEDAEKKTEALGELVSQGESAIAVLKRYMEILDDHSLDTGDISKAISVIEEINADIKRES